MQVHLHKSFVELHFSSRPLPQNVSVVACVDGKALDTVLPGQVRHSRREAVSVSSARTLDASAYAAAAVHHLRLGCYPAAHVWSIRLLASKHRSVLPGVFCLGRLTCFPASKDAMLSMLMLHS